MPAPTLPALTFYRMADRLPAAATIPALWDALFAAVTSTNDYRGTLIPGSHSWPWDRFQNVGVTEAVYTTGVPAGSTMTLSPRYIFAGDAAGSAVTMASPDATGANATLVGITKNGGAYNNWKNALPHTAGQFFGYWRCGRAALLNVASIVRVYVSQESVFVQFIETGGTTQSWAYLGPIIIPYSTDTVLAAEADNRLYGMLTSGSTNGINADWLSADSTATSIFSSSVGSGEVHFGTFTPGLGTLLTCGRRNSHVGIASANDLISMDGIPVGDAIEVGRNSASLTPNGNRMGVLRGIYQAGEIQSGRWVRDGATDLYHYVSVSNVGAADGLMLTAAP